MINKDLKSAVAGRNAKTVRVIFFVAIVMALSTRYDILTQPAHACDASAVLEIDVLENGNWVNRSDQTIYVALHSPVDFWAVPFPEGSQWALCHPIWSDDAIDYEGEFIAITFDTVGEFKITTGPDTQTVTVVVVEIEKIQWRLSGGTYADVPNPATIYIAKGAQVEFKAIKNPSSASWPSGKPVWGGSSGASGTGETKSVTFDTTSTTATDYKTVSASCGNTVTLNTVVVAVDKIEVQEGGSWVDRTGQTIYVDVGTTVSFRAQPDPTGATWPAGKPNWGGSSGASGTSTTTTVTFGSVSASSTDYKTVTCECSNTVNVNVIVVGVGGLQWSETGNDPWTNVSATTQYVPLGATRYFKALPAPTGATWPSDKPAWSGTSKASGTGETATVTFDTTSTSATDYKTVAVNCGNTVTLNMVVITTKLKSVSFGGSNHTVWHDNGTTAYTGPHWEDKSPQPDGDADDVGDRKYPICYTRNTTMTVSVAWLVTPSNIGATIKVMGDGPDDLDFPPTTASFNSGNMSITDVDSSHTLKNEVDYMDPMSIAWKLSFDGGTTWLPAGTSANQTYVTLGDPLSSVYHTVVHLGCKNADSCITSTSCTAAIWGDFTDRDVRRVDGFQLTYYNSYLCTNTTTADLLKYGDGQCGAWACLFIDILKVQGFSNQNNYVIIYSTSADGFLVKNWNFNGSGSSGNPSFPYLNLPNSPFVGTGSYNWKFSEVNDSAGIPGQGTSNPASFFNNHQMALINGIYHDPSYGVQYNSLQDIDNSLDGFYAGIVTYPVDEPTVNLDLNGDGDKLDTNINTGSYLLKVNPAGINISEQKYNY